MIVLREICSLDFMLKPTFEEFKEKSNQGNLIPVYKEIFADLDTPVSAYMKVSGG